MSLKQIILCFTFAGVTCSFAQTPTMEDKWWSPDYFIKDMCVNETNGNIYVVGDFTGVHPPNWRCAFIDQNAGTARADVSRFIFHNSSKVDVAIPDETGGWYFGGSGWPGWEPTWQGLMYMDSDGTLIDWNPMIDGRIHDMLILGDTLYIGGNFDSVDGISRRNLASFDISTGNLTDWNPETAGTTDGVNALATDGTKIFVGGEFALAGGELRSHLAAFDRATGSLTGWAPSQLYPVRSLVFYNNVIYTAPGPGPYPIIRKAMAFDSNFGAQLPWSVTISGGGRYANIITVIDDMIYIGGDFTVQASFPYQFNLAIADPLTAELTITGFNCDGEILAITSTDESIYLGGDFSEVNGVDRNNAAAIDKETGTVNDWNPDANGAVSYLLAHENWILAAGDFHQLGSVSRNGFVELSGETGGPTEWAPEIDIPIGINKGLHEVKIYDNKLFIAGRFNSEHGNNLAVFDLNSKLPIDLFSEYPDDVVYSMEFHDNKLYIGGTFLSVGSDIRNYLACYDLETGDLTEWAPLPNGQVKSLEIYEDKVFIGGGFTMLNGFARSRLGAVSSIDGTLLPWDPSVGSPGGIYTILAAEDEIFVGGVFEEIGTVERNLVASIDINTGAVNPWNANLGEIQWAEKVNDLAIFGDKVYIGGSFDEVAGNPVFYFAEVDRLTGDLSTTNPELVPAPEPFGGTEAIHIFDNKIYLAGRLTFEPPSEHLKSNLGVLSPLCSPPVLNEIAASQLSICPGTETELTVSDGTLNSASDWIWNTESCDNIEGITGQVITVSPMQTTTYYVKPVDGCSEFSELACLSITIEVEEDVTPPEITAPENTILTNDDDECFSTDINAIGMAEGMDTCSEVVITNDAPATFPIGETVVTWFAKDESENVASATQVVTVEDTQSPLIICSNDITVAGDMENCGANVTWVTPEITDNCSSEVSISSTHSSGDLFEYGITEVTYTAEDDAGNSTTCTFEISVVSNFEIEYEVFNISCANGSDGVIDLNVIGEGSGFIFEWEGPSGFSSEEENLSDLEAGTYSVTVTSGNGCSSNAEITVSSPEELTFEGTSTPISTGNSGAITVVVEGGTGPYTFLWEGPGNYTATTQNLENLSEPGVYILTVTDSNGCTSSFEIELDSTVGIDEIKWTSVVYPNPLISRVNFELPSELIGKSLTLYDVTGKVLDQFLIEGGVFTINMEKYAEGLYFVDVESVGKTFKIVKQ